MVSRVKDNNPFGTQETVSLDFDEEKIREGRQGNFKISKLNTFTSRRRYMAEILPIRRKMLSNLSINQSIHTCLAGELSRPVLTF